MKVYGMRMPAWRPRETRHVLREFLFGGQERSLNYAMKLKLRCLGNHKILEIPDNWNTRQRELQIVSE